MHTAQKREASRNSRTACQHSIQSASHTMRFLCVATVLALGTAAAPSTADAVDTADTADATDVAGGADTDTVDTVDTAATATTAATTDIAEGAGVEEEDATAATAATTDLAEGAGVEEDVAAAAMGEDAELPSSLSRFRKLAKSPAKSMKTAKKVLQARTNKPLKSSSDTGMV